MKKKVIFFALLIFFTFSLIEISLRCFYFQKDSNYTTAFFQFFRHVEYKFGLLNPQFYVKNKTFGYFHEPNSQEKHIHSRGDFEVNYTIDQEGFRVTPNPKNNKGKIIILGCSFTFGWGVEDQESYPFVLGEKYWNDYKVVNFSANGWGTTNIFLACKNTLEQENPKLIIYAMIPAHISRNIRDEKEQEIFWFKDVPIFSYPYFVVRDDAIVLQEWHHLGKEIELPKSKIEEQEIEITTKLILEMDSMCKEKNVAFIVALLPGFKNNWPLSIVLELQKKHICFVDLTHLKFGAFKNDRHPNKEDHAKIAQNIAHLINTLIK